jgi:hypothetical protein
MLAATRFLWNATRGSRLAPWRSPYIRWRIETYSGMKAESMTDRDVFAFLWREKWNLLRFLRWTSELDSLQRASRARG